MTWRDRLEEWGEDVAWRARRLAGRTRAWACFALAPHTLARCEACGRRATWCYTPGNPPWFHCDACVPRGCSCQMNDDGTPRRDRQGREVPCCEFSRDPAGFPRR